ncbi:MAG: DNA primase small subunit domain-containing protein [Desulfurococcaceae archaeon]
MSRLEQISRMGFLRKIIRDYYSRKTLEEPSDLHKREIALESLEDNSYIRHLSFPYMQLLYDYIMNVKTPLHLYYSSALYSTPYADKMENKIWEGSELLFDIDADKYQGCDQKIWICPSSGEISPVEIDKCSRGEKPLEYSSLPWVCIKKAWNDVLKLVDVLKTEFGYERIRIYYSGNRGFHVKVQDPDVLALTREMRRAIADYVSCEGLKVEKMFPSYKNMVIFGEIEHGIRRRVYQLASNLGLLEKKKVKGIRDLEVLDIDKLTDLLGEVCIQIDKAVTMDISRLSRFGNSLNMKAGLKVMDMSINADIDAYDYERFSPFKGFIKVKSLITGDINALGMQLSLSKGNIYRLESFIGIYLVVKNIALPVDVSELEVKV